MLDRKARVADNYNRIVGNKTVGNAIVGKDWFWLRSLKMRDRLKQGVGGVVTKERFWDRENEKKLFVARIDEGAHILLVAQRRMGKTSLMAEAAEILREKYLCLFVDLEKSRSGMDAMAELSIKMQPYKGLWDKTKEMFSNVLTGVTDRVDSIEVSEIGVKLRSGLTRGNWAAKGDQLLDILAGSGGRVVVMLDEVPILVNKMLKDKENRVTAEGRAEADEFMSWLRKNSIKHQGKMSFVICGSIGLEPILHQAGLSATINNFVPFELDPWDDETAKECLLALGKEYGIEFDKGVTEDMVKRLGCCIPHHVQMFFTNAYDRCVKRGNMRCTIADVGDVYTRDMLGVRGHVELIHYEERLEKVLDKELLKLALDMLTEAAVTGCLTKEATKAFQGEYELDGRDVAEGQKEILWVLEHDGYLEKGAAGYVFVSKLLRDWWKNRHGMFFTPVLERGA